MSVDSRLLIRQIEARRPLWDREDKNYCHKQIISKLWEEIALVHGVHESKVKSRWKALRDTYRQEVKKNLQHSSWGYYSDMQFLRSQLKTIPPAHNSASHDEDSENVAFVKTEPDVEDWGVGGEEGCEGGDPGLAPEVEPDSSRGDLRNLDDDDLHFLLSLLPEMRKLSPQQKLPLRIKIIELLYKEAYRQEHPFRA